MWPFIISCCNAKRTTWAMSIYRCSNYNWALIPLFIIIVFKQRFDTIHNNFYFNAFYIGIRHWEPKEYREFNISVIKGEGHVELEPAISRTGCLNLRLLIFIKILRLIIFCWKRYPMHYRILAASLASTLNMSVALNLQWWQSKMSLGIAQYHHWHKVTLRSLFTWKLHQWSDPPCVLPLIITFSK